MDILANLALAFGGAIIFMSPAIALCAMAEHNEKVKRFFEWIGEKYF